MSVQVKPGRTHPHTAVGQIEFCAISASEWRVSDTSIPAGDAGSVLGFVEQVEDRGYEVLQLRCGHGVDKLTLRSLDEVVAHFARRARTGVSGGTDRREESAADAMVRPAHE
jgi:methionine aminopeptidase